MKNVVQHTFVTRTSSNWPNLFKIKDGQDKVASTTGHSTLATDNFISQIPSDFKSKKLILSLQIDSNGKKIKIHIRRIMIEFKTEYWNVIYKINRF